VSAAAAFAARSVDLAIPDVRFIHPDHHDQNENIGQAHTTNKR
jgi:hypothetical protein